jgi:hypothetical protein
MNTRRVTRAGRIEGHIMRVVISTRLPESPDADRLPDMFGPLNGVRVALVSFAVVAALAALLAGYPFVAMVLFLGVAVHGLGWLYLYRQHLRRSPD